jgi:hypothetical protein
LLTVLTGSCSWISFIEFKENVSNIVDGDMDSVGHSRY